MINVSRSLSERDTTLIEKWKEEDKEAKLVGGYCEPCGATSVKHRTAADLISEHMAKL